MNPFTKLALPLAAASGAVALSANARADAIIPSGFNPNIIVTVNSDGSFHSVDNSNVPYDGDEDVLVQVINHSSTPLLSLDLQSNTDIFGFDSDGISAYTGLASDATGYGSPDSYFGNIAPSLATGTVFFGGGGVSAGGTDYFSLEDLVSVDGGSFIVVPPATPVADPAGTAGLLGAALLGLSTLRRRLFGR